GCDVDGDGAGSALVIETSVPLEGAAHDTARLVPAGETLPLPGEASSAALLFQGTDRDPDPGYVADGAGIAVAAQPDFAERVADATPAAMAHDEPATGAASQEEGPASNGRLASRNLLIAVAVVALVSLSGAAAWWLRSSPSAPHEKRSIALASSVASSADRVNAPVPSMVVLPFVNLSGDATRDYLADGITDSLISDLAYALPKASIVSRDTAFTYKGRGADARQIGRELEVRYLLEGSVVLEDERVRVNTRLVETKEASQLWAERFDTELKSILEVQDEIVARVSRAIGLQVVDLEARRSWRERPDNPALI